MVTQQNIKNQWCWLFLLLILCTAVSISNAQNSKPESVIIPVGKVDTTWKGMMSIPVWAETDVFFTGTTPVILPEDVKSFKLKIDWQGNNKTRLDEESSVIMKVEAEDPPYSGNWKLVFEKRDDIVCKKSSSSQEVILSEPIIQNKPEIRYKISLSSVLAVGPRSGYKETYIVVKLSSINYDTYTTIPFIPIAVLHDPSGDHSWSGIKSSSCLLRLLTLQLGNKPLSIYDQKEILFHDPRGSLRVKPFYNQENYMEISFFPNVDITSEKTSEDSCLIGPGLGDVYVLVKNLPLRLSLVETFSHKAKTSKLFFTVVSPEEAGFGPNKKLEIIIVPAASLRFFEEGHPAFGTWQQYGITDSFRKQLIKINPGWDNVISSYEKDSLIYLGKIFLNYKDKTLIRWNQEILHPLTVDLDIDISPSFVEKLQLPLPKGTVPMSIIMNSKPYAKSTIPEDVILSLKDNEQGDRFPDFFSYDAYLDRYFGTPLFITNDDKTTPADTRSLQVRSISSSPHEFWTGTYETPIISGQITAIDGKIPKCPVIYLKQDDKVIKKDTASTDGFYKISVPFDDNRYSLLVQCEGYEDVTIPAITFSADKRDVVVNVFMPVKPEPVIEKEPIKKTIPQIPDKEMVIIKEDLPTKVLPPPEILPPVMLLKNNDFSEEMKDWSILQDGLGTMKIIITVDDEKEDTAVLDLYRQNSERNMGSLGIMQSIEQNVSRYNQISLSMDVKIISLEDTGTQGSDFTPSSNTYPVVVEVEYKDKAGKTCLWKKTFSVMDETDGKKMPVDKWITYVSPNLAELKPKPQIISNVKLYGSGWDFHSRITGLVFVAREMGKEVGSGQWAVDSGQQGAKEATATTKSVAVSSQQVAEKATATTKPVAVVPEKATATAKPTAVVPEKATVTTKPAAVISEKATVTTKPTAVVPEKATATAKPAAVVSEKATATAKPAAVVPEKATVTAKPAPVAAIERPIETSGAIKNYNFSSDTRCWNMLKVGSGQIMNLSVVKDTAKYPYVLDINRQGSGKQKGVLGLIQNISLDVATHTLITLSTDIKVLSATLDSDGKKGGVYPVTLEITYSDKAGKEHSWRHGFLASKRLNYPEIGEMVDGDTWVAYKSANLAMLKPRPSVIKCVKVYGEGWGFHGQVTNLVLASEYAPDIVIHEEVGSGQQVADSGQWEVGSGQQVAKEATVTTKPTAVVSEKATVTAKPTAVVPEKATVTTKPAAVISEKATATTKPAAVISEKATVTTKPAAVVSEKATVTAKPATVVPEKATATTKPTAVVPEKATVTAKPAPVAAIERPIETSGAIKNYNFSSDTRCWNMLKVGSGQIMNLSVVKNTAKYPYVLDINRQGSGKQKGVLGLIQNISLDVATHTLITFSADIKVLSATLDSDGKKGGVYPVTLEITYSDKAGKEHSWRHGFLASKRLNYPEIGEMVDGDTWVAYKSANLAMLKPRPSVIKCVKVYGEGWGFHGQVTNLVLASEYAPDVVIHEEVGSGQQVADSGQWPMDSGQQVAKEAMATTKPAAVVSEKATVTAKPATVVPEKATATTKSAAVISEKATATTKPTAVVPEKATVTAKPAPVAAIERPIETSGAIKNYNFSSDTRCWNMLKVGSGQIMNLSVVKDTAKYPYVLDINRQGSGKQKGVLGLIQNISLDVATHTLITLSADIKVLSATLDSDGKKGGVYPVTLEITYSDKAGKEHSWRHGFLASKRLNYPEIGEMVDGDTWVAYKSANLAMLKPRPAVIKCVKVYGEGWGFHGQVTNLVLASEYAPDVVIHEEVGSGQQVADSGQWPMDSGQQVAKEAMATTKPAAVVSEKATATAKPAAVVSEKATATAKPTAVVHEKATVTTKPATVISEKATATTKPTAVVSEKATATAKPAAVVSEKATATAKPAAVVSEKATVTAKPTAVVPEKATATTKPTAVVSEKATVTAKPAAVISEKATATAKPATVVPEKATATTKSAAVISEKATATTKPTAVVPEKATATAKPAPVAEIERPIETSGAIKNYNFSSDTRCWNMLKVGSGQIMNLSVVKDTAKYPYVLDINRQGSGKQKGVLGLSQNISLDVATHTLITLSADIKVLSATLDSDGKKGGVYPVTLEITYSDKAGKEHSWRHGFLASKRLNYPDIGEMVDGDTWVAYKSANLAMLKPRPAVIKCVKVYGEGWGFHGQVTNLVLASEYAPDIVIHEEVGSGKQVADSGQWPVGSGQQVAKEATATTKPMAVVSEKATATAKPTAVVPEKATVTAKPAAVVSEKATATAKPAAVISEKATATTKPVAVVPEKATATAKPTAVVPEKATATTKPAAVISEKATVTTKPTEVVPEKATATAKPAPVAAIERPIEIAGAIKNYNFSSDTRCWNMLKVGSGQIMNLSVVKDTAKYPYVLDINRQGSGKQKGVLGLIQNISLDVATHTLITLSADIKVLSATLDSDGKKGGVYPVTLEITYSDKAGKEHSWRHGFLANKRLNYPEIGEMVDGNTWVAYKSANLAMLKPRPSVIKCVKVYGEGWGFHGQVTNLVLASEYAPDIVIHEEVGSRKQVADSGQWPVDSGQQVAKEATATTKPTAVVSEKATATAKPTAVVPEKATVTTKPTAVVSEKATVTTKPAPTIEDKKTPPIEGEKPVVISTDEMKEILEQVALPEMGTPSTGTIKNNNFSAGLQCWQPIKSGDGELILRVVREISAYPYALEFNRKDGEKTKGSLGVSQDMNLPVSDNKLITISADIKVLSATLDSDGKNGGVYPVTLEIAYNDKAGKEHSWRHGFLPASKRLNYPEIGELIAENTWVTYKSENLAMLTPRPATITCVKVYGEGWGFHSRVTNLVLALEDAPDIVIPEEVVSSQQVAISGQWAVGSGQQVAEEATVTTKPVAVVFETATATTTPTPIVKAEKTPIEETSQPSLQDTTPAEKMPDTLIKNGDFTHELNSWEWIKEGSTSGNALGIAKIEVINENSDYPFVLEINRTGSGGQKGVLGLKQKIEERIDDYTLLAIVMDIKVVSSSLESDGTNSGEYPVCVEIMYEDRAGIFHTWKQGFLYAENINYPKIGVRVPKDKWYIYLSTNLTKLEPKPKMLKEIRIYGQGHDFVARIANLNLIGGKMTIPPR